MTDPIAIFRTVLGESSLPMAATQGRSHLVVYVNPAFCRLVGRSDEALLGHPLPEVLGEIGGVDASALLDRVFSTGGGHTRDGRDAPARAPADAEPAP